MQGTCRPAILEFQLGAPWLEAPGPAALQAPASLDPVLSKGPLLVPQPGPARDP